MATLSTVAVDFTANTSKFTEGLKGMSRQTKAWSDSTKKEMQGVSSAAASMSSAINKAFAAVSIGAIVLKFAAVSKEISNLADEAEKVGASAEQFAILDVAARKNGTSIQAVKTGYKELQKSINEAKNGTKETTEAFQALGLSYSYLASVNPDKRFLAVADALSKVSDENKRAELGTILLGKSYTELSALIAKGSFNINVAGASGALSEKDIKTIDSVTKAFEEISNVIDKEFKKALVDLAPALLFIVDVSKGLIENWGKIVSLLVVLNPGIQNFATSILTSIGKAFDPTYLNGFLKGGTHILVALAKNAEDWFSYIAEVGLLKFSKLGDALTLFGSAGAAIFTKLTVLATVMTASFGGLIGTVLVLAGAFSAAFLTGLVAMEGLMTGIAKLIEMVDKNSTVARDFRESARYYREAREDVVAKVLNLDRGSKTPEQIAQEIHAAQLIIQRDANKAGQALDEETNKLNALKEKGKEFLKDLISFSDGVKKSVATPYESAVNELTKLTNAVDIGTISVEDYRRAVDKLVSSLDYLDASKLREAFGTGPFGAIRPEKDNSILFAKRAAQQEAFGAGTQIGLPPGFSAFEKGATNMEKFTKAEEDRIRSFGKGLRESTMTAKEIYDRQVKDIEAASTAVDEYGQSLITAEQKTRALKQANDELFLSVNPWVNDVKDIFSNFASGFEDAVLQAKSFSDVLKGLANDIMRVLFRQVVLRQLFNIGGALLGQTSFGKNIGVGGNLGDLTFGGGKASGGPVSSNSMYMVGEDGPELFVPNTNGYIVPNNLGGGGGVTINQNNVFQSGVTRSEVFSLIPRIKAETMAAVADGRARGGSYGKALTA